MVDCYYDIANTCPSAYGYGTGAYGAVGTIVGSGPYAAIGIAGPGFANPNIYGFGRLSATDLVGVHGANR